MKKLVAIVLCCVSAPTFAQSPREAFLSTEVLSDNQVAFRIHAPAAKKVTLRTGNILDNLLAAGNIRPMIVVMPNGTIETDKLLDRVPIFTDDLITGIIPFVEANYNVHTDSANRAIMGLSMGGLETLEAALFHYEKFDYIFALSSGWWLSIGQTISGGSEAPRRSSISVANRHRQS